TRNLDSKTRLKTLYKKAAVAADTELVKDVESQFDKAAQKGTIHPNKAARKKSRLAKAVKAAANAPVKPVKSAKAKSTKKTSKKTSKK
ncbi:MAG: 30S ribosomal protein S20, partial [Candidatus Eremiobacteraeota bacterium]|nr:30S ribosomal protein S20 [Candidatus Eremiobacteraeota bacterium]